MKLLLKTILYTAVIISCTVNTKSVQAVDTEANNPLVHDDLNIIMYVDTPLGLRVRDAPGINGRILGALKYLAEVNIVREDTYVDKINDIVGRWVYINRPIEGWVFNAYLVKTDEKYFRWEVHEDGVIITGYTGYDSNIWIPSKIQGMPVVGIGEEAFAGGSYYPSKSVYGGEYDDDEFIPGRQLAHVFIPDSVTFIGDKAFVHNLLTTVTIPDSVISIGKDAFWNNRLTSATIGSSVTHIGDRAFHNNQLTSVTIPNSVTFIGVSAFSSNQIASITIGSGITTIGNSVFADNKLTSLTIPDTVTSIGESAFSSNELSSLTIATDRTNIGKNAFRYNPLANLTLGMARIPNEFMEHIMGLRIHDEQHTLTNVVILDSVTHIGRGAFHGTRITNITIPATVTSIERWAFAGIDNLTIGMVNIPGSLADDYNTFSVHSTLTILDSVTSIGDRAFTGSRLTSVVIPDSVTSIGDAAFAFNRLTSVIIGNSVTHIGKRAFMDNRLTKIIIPDSVTHIGDAAFMDNLLPGVKIPKSVKHVGRSIF
ncbi:MAG: leucine-rich repeat protein [Treponema sp.]|nr:leucine-rich repeat protein [Treponema sp.]